MAFLSPAALADVSASSSISGIHYELIDLDPNDGVIPEITFTGSRASAGLGFIAWENGVNTGETKSLSSAGTIEVTRPFGNAAASTSSDGVSTSVFLQSPGPVTSSGSVSSRFVRDFILSPNTGLLWTAVGSLAAVAPGVGTTLRFEGTLLDDEGSLTQQRRFSQKYDAWFGGGTVDLYGFLFTDDEALSGDLTVYSSSFALANSVPEPSTWGMLFAGLAVVAARLRRKSA